MKAMEQHGIRLTIEHVKPVTINSYYKKFKNRLIISKEGVDYKEAILANLPREPTPLRGAVKLDLEFHFTDRRVHDLDNLFKPIVDILKNQLFEDDKEIFEIHSRKKLQQDRYRIIIGVERYQECQATVGE
jgi:crossover junction endodeoxyribonuclease RusA